MDNKRERIKKYFKPFPKWTLWAMGLGVLFLPAMGIGLIPIVAGIVGVVMWFQKPSDAEMDAWIGEDLQGLQERALSKTGIDASELVAETVMVYGPRFWRIGGAYPGIRKGGDGFVRFTPLGITVINFTAHQLIAYQCALDLMTGNPLSESTDEYFYRDVVSVATQSQSRTFDVVPDVIRKGPLGALMQNGKLQLNAAEIFALTTSGGTSIEVVLSDPQLIERAGGGSIPSTGAEKAVAAVRKMLREKKSVAASA